MPAGVFYEDNFEVERELYAVDSGYRLQGGFNLVPDNLSAQSHVPTLCPLHLDYNNRKAYVVNNVKVAEAVELGAKTIKIAKGSFARKGISYMLTGDVLVAVSAMDTTNEAYDVLTVSATTAAIAVDSVLTECTVAEDKATAAHTANALNYARTKIETGATVTALGRAYEIKENELYIPVTDADKATLSDRFMFVPLK